MRPILFAALAALAGCVATPPEVPEDRPPFEFELADVGSAPSGSVAGRSEAFLAVVGTERLACTHGAFERPALAWASIDEGATWSELTFPPDTGVGGDCDVAIAPDGTWHVLHSTVQSATLTSSDDQGASWRVQQTITLPLSGMADRPWLVAAPDGRLILTAMDVFAGPGFVQYSASTDGGRTWSAPQLIASPSPEYPQRMHGRALLDANGTIRVPIREMILTEPSASFGSPARTQLTFAVSTDHGATWTREPVGDAHDGYSAFPIAALTTDGGLFFAELYPAGDDIELRVVASADGGATWSEAPVATMRNIGYTAQPWTDGGPTTAAIAWTAVGQDEEDRHLHVARARVGPGGVAVEALARPGPSSDPEFLSVDHDPSGRAHIAIIQDATMHVWSQTR